MNELSVIIFLVVFGIFLFWLFGYIGRINRWRTPRQGLSNKEKLILASKVNFYRKLTDEEKVSFEYRTAEFLENVKVTGVGIKATETDRLLIAASAIIPVFRFPEWFYPNIRQVLLYPDSFDEDFQTDGEEIEAHNTGMVGNGPLEDKMILSKPDLHSGFANEWDNSNVGIHEFVHLIDKADGAVDGVPRLFLEKNYIAPWLELIRKNIEEILKGRSDINPYGTKDKTEFFAVVSEYFFENPERFQTRHPELFELMEKMFRVKKT
jgi:MtfA peptidase